MSMPPSCTIHHTSMLPSEKRSGFPGNMDTFLVTSRARWPAVVSRTSSWKGKKKKDQRATVTNPPGAKGKPQSLLAPAPTTLHLTLYSSMWTPASTWASSPTDYLAVRKYSSLSWPQFSHLLNGNDAPCSSSSRVCIYVRATCSREHTCVDVDGSRRQPQASFPVPGEPSPCWGFSFVLAAVGLFAGDGTLSDPTGLELTDYARLPGS